LADNLKKIRNRFRGRLHNSGRYGEFLKHHETDIGELLEIVEQQKQETERLKKVSQVTNDDWIEQHKEIVRYRKALEEIAGNRCCGFHWQHKELAEKLLG
jgi:hypothetical protein